MRFPKVKLRVILYSLLLIFLFSISTLPKVLSSSEGHTPEELKLQIKQELKQELIEEMRQMVHSEVEAKFNEYIAKKEDESSLKGEEISKRSPDSENLDEAMRRIIRETIKEMDARIDLSKTVSDAELDQYSASGLEAPSLGIGSGLEKTLMPPDFSLAKADPGAKKASDKKLDKSTGGGQTSETAESVERVLKQRGSMLLPKGTLQVEPSITYSHYSSNRISIDGILLLDVFAIGEISTESIKRDIVLSNLSLKYGLLRNLQTELKIPYRIEHDLYSKTSGDESADNASGIGDIEVSLSRQVAWEQGLMPGVIAALALKPPTGKDPYNTTIGMGSGHWSTRASLVAVKSSDPVVVFGSLSYTHNFERDNIEKLGTIEPGPTIGYSLGTAIALSYQTAMNFSFNHSLTLKTHRNGDPVANSFLNVGTLKTGLNWSFNERSSIDLGVSIGMTPNSPDITVEIRFPTTF